MPCASHALGGHRRASEAFPGLSVDDALPSGIRFSHFQRSANRAGWLRIVPMRIKLTSLMVENQNKAIAFYTEILGFVKKRDIPMGGEFR